ncbi:MAG TPA: tetratricopeptide repeat protein [Candidatus Binataceae bacterium]
MSENQPHPMPSGKRLNSWKEIAAHLQRDVRTVQRWEKTEGLPVHRKLHDKLSSVYAYQEELDAWWQAGSRANASLAVTVQPLRPMLVVLPLRNLSGDPVQDYFSEGLTEELTGQLGRLDPSRLGVIAYSSAARYRQNNQAIDQIARALRASYVIEGSVRRDHDRVRISVALVRVTDQSHLWSESYDRGLRDILTVQAEVARAVAGEIAVKIPAAEQARLIHARPVDPAAYNAYLRGRYFWNQRTASALRTALRCFEESVARDPNHAPSHAGIADTYAVLSLIELGALAPSQAMPKAKAAARRAIEIEPGMGEAYASLGLAQLWYEWDWNSAEQSFKKAISLNAGYAPARQWYAALLQTDDRMDEAVAEIGRALELDPLSLVIRSELAALMYFERQYDRAIAESEQALEMDPRFVLAYFNLGRAYTQKKMHSRAINALKQAYEFADGSPAVMMQLGHAYAAAGKKAEARHMLDSLAKLSRKGYVPAFYSAAIHTGLRDKERAFTALRRAYDERCDYLVHLAKEPAADPLRSDPRFELLLPGPHRAV